jgi:sugar phosphate isomerase/epimerase
MESTGTKGVTIMEWQSREESRCPAEPGTHTPAVGRRRFLAGTASAGLAWAVSPQAAGANDAAAPPRKAASLKTGISTLGFPNHTNEALAEELAEAGFGTVQLFLTQSDSRYWNYNGRSDVSGLTAKRSEEIGNVYRSAGLSIHSIGVYTNLIHPDASEVKANLAYFEAMLKIGDDMGVRVFITEAGHYHGEGPEPATPLHFQDEVWPRMVSTFRDLAGMAQARKAVILVEPYYQGFFASAKRTRIFLEEVNSPSIRALLDPANLLELNDLDEMFLQLALWVDCLHAKDRKLHTQAGVPAGQGDLDYVKFVRLAAAHTPDAPLILEYVGPGDYREAWRCLRSAMEEADR